MSIEENKAVVRRMIEGWLAGDLDAAVSAYVPDFRYHNPVLAEMPSLPLGREAMRQLMAATSATFPDLHSTSRS